MADLIINIIGLGAVGVWLLFMVQASFSRSCTRRLRAADQIWAAWRENFDSDEEADLALLRSVDDSEEKGSDTGAV